MNLLAAFAPRSRPPARPEPVRPPPLRAQPPVIALPPPPPQPQPRFNLRHTSPRRFAEIVHELYVEGSLRWEEYQWVGFPSELHPDYNTTIGALTGDRAAPDRPRDMLAEVESHFTFLRRFLTGDAIHRAERALDVLKRQTEPR